MPIINSQLGGKKPTGTKQITTNGTHDVTDYATADVNVPTTAPDYFVAMTKDNNNKLIFDSNYTSVDFTGVTDFSAYVLQTKYKQTPISSVVFNNPVAFSGNYCCSQAFMQCYSISNIDLSGVTSITGDYACSEMFCVCASLTSVDLSNLTTISGDHACYNMFQNCKITGALDLSSLTTVGSSGCRDMFSGCNYITSVDLSGLTTFTGSENMNAMFITCTGLQSVDLSGVVHADTTGCFSNFLNNCSSLTTVNMSNLVSVGSYGLYGTFYACAMLTSIDLSKLSVLTQGSCLSGTFQRTGLTSMDFASLATISTPNGSTFGSCFSGCQSLQHVYFKALDENSITGSGGFNNMLSNVTGCTIHLPKNADPQTGSTITTKMGGYPNFGGTNTIVLFDQPDTTPLHGADTVIYYRNPKYDTAGALAWRIVKDGSSFVPYYTSGTTDPQVGDTIYSDDACTTAVTTISSIA